MNRRKRHHGAQLQHSKSRHARRRFFRPLGEQLEDRRLLAVISPVYSGSIFDCDKSGSGDDIGAGYHSGGQPTVGHGDISPFSSCDARAVAEFEIGGLAGQTIQSASISANAWYADGGGPTVNWYFYAGDGNRSTTDYHEAATLFESVSPTGGPYPLNVDVTSELQSLLNGGATFAAFRGERVFGTAAIGWDSPIVLNVTSVIDTTAPTVTSLSPEPGSSIATSAVVIDVTFSEAVIGVDASDLVLSGTAGGSVGTPTNTIDNTWQFPISGLRDGTLNISLAPDANDIEDLAGNDLPNLTWSYGVALSTEVSYFSNSASINILSNGPSNPYPSSIDVSGLNGVVADVDIILSGLSHSYPADMDILVQSPSGHSVILMSDAGGGASIVGRVLTFDDAAASYLPLGSTIASGTYKPTNDAVNESFPSPAPGGGYQSVLSAFNGTNPNGEWKLFVLDDTSGNSGNIAGGWSIQVTTIGTLSASVDETSRLVVADTDGIGKDNSLTVKIVNNGADLEITDANEQFQSAPVGATLTNGNRTLVIPLTAINSLALNTGGGNDALTIDLSGGDVLPDGGLVFNGGGDYDSLVVTGGNQGTVTYNTTNSTDGSIEISNFGVISYTGLEPITNTGSVADIVFNLPDGPSNVLLDDDGMSGNGLSQLRSNPVSFATLAFANPTNSLTVNPGHSNDVLSVMHASDFDRTLTLGSESVRFAHVGLLEPIALAPGHDLAIAATTIGFEVAAAGASTQGAGSIKLDAARSISMTPTTHLTAVDGDITLRANQGTTFTSGGFSAIEINNAEIAVTGAGSLTLQGRAGDSGSSYSGIRARNGAQISGGAGSVLIEGVGASGGGNSDMGVSLFDAGTMLGSSGGDIVVVGSGSSVSSGTGAFGVYVAGGARIVAGGNGSVTVTGSGGVGFNANDSTGVLITGNGSAVVGNGGNVVVTGTGGGSGTSGSNEGVFVTNGGQIAAGGAGLVTVTGQGGGGSGNESPGVFLRDANSSIRSHDGDIHVTGLGGGEASSSASRGVVLWSGGSIEASGDGDVIVHGQGGNTSGDSNFGVWVVYGGARVASATGSVEVVGTGGGSGTANSNYGVLVNIGGVIESEQAGQVIVAGTGGNSLGNFNRGVFVTGASSAIRSGDGGSILVRGTPGAGTNREGVRVESGQISAGANGSVGFYGDSMQIFSGAVVSASSGTVTLAPETVGHSIGLGATDGAGVLGLTDAELDRIAATYLIIGSPLAGAIHVSQPISPASVQAMVLNSSSTVTQAAEIVTSGLGVSAGGAITLEHANNDVFAFAAKATTGSISFANSNDVAVGFVHTIPGVTATNGSVMLRSFGGNVRVLNTPAVKDISSNFTVTILADTNDALLRVDAGAVIESTMSGGFNNFRADKMQLDGSLTAPSGVIFLSPFNAGDAIVLGSTSDAAVNTLELSDQELDRVTAAGLRIGDGLSGPIQINAPITRPSATDLRLTTGGPNSIVFEYGSAGSLNAGGGALTLITGTGTNSGGIDGNPGTTNVTAGKLTVVSGIRGVGASGNYLTTAVDAVTASSNNSAIHIREADQVTIVAPGLNGSLIHLESGVFLYDANDLIPDTANVTVRSGAMLNTNGFSDRIGSLNISGGPTVAAQVATGSGTLTLGAGGISYGYSSTGAVGATISGNLDLGGAVRAMDVPNGAAAADLTITAVLTNGGLRKTGAGTLVLTGDSSYAGATTIDASTLLVTGSISDSHVTLNGSTLSGTGTTGTVTVNVGAISPGSSSGILHTGSVSLDADSTFAVELNGTVAGAEYDQLHVIGSVAIDNATLAMTLGYAPAAGDTFVIIQNDGTDAVTGTFSGLPEGARITDFLGSGLNAIISYAGGTGGNDVVLTLVSPNSPPTAVAGGPYVVSEGSPLTLNASASSDPDSGDTLVYEWDLDYDGVTFQVDASGRQPSVVFPDSFAERTIAVRVTDQGNLSDIATSTLTVTNVAPIAVFNAPQLVQQDAPVVLSLDNAADPSAKDVSTGLRYSFAFDGQDTSLATSYDAAGTSSSATSTFGAPGTYTVKGRVFDKDGGYSTYLAQVIVIFTNQFGTATEDVAMAVASDATGIYVTGYTSGSLDGTTLGSRDAFVRKYDHSGAVQWTRQFGTAASDAVYGIATDSTGVYVTGNTFGSLGGTNAGSSDVFIRKYDHSGIEQWTRQFGTTTDDYGNGIAADATGVYVTGYTYGGLDGTNVGKLDVFVRKYDSNGAVQWTRQFGTAGNDFGIGIATDSTGVYVTGSTFGSLGGTNAGGDDVFIRKYDHSGIEQWTRQFGTTTPDAGFGIAADATGVYVTGYTYGGLDGTNARSSDVFIRKYDQGGIEQWTRQFGTTTSDWGLGIAADATGVYVTGYTYGGLDGTNAGSSDVFIRKYDHSGAAQWTRQFGTTASDTGRGIATDSTGVYVTGFTGGNFGGTSAGGSDAFLTKLVVSSESVAGAGSVINGYLVGATAFFDVNKNGALDAGEPWAPTDAQGAFRVSVPAIYDTNENGVLDDEEGQWIVFGGTDSSTGLPSVSTLVAPGSWRVVTPLTTLVSTMAASYGLSLADAEARLITALDLPAVDLSTLDPIAETLAGNSSAPAIFAAHAMVQDTVAQAASLLAAAAGAPPAEQLRKTIVADLAAQIMASPSGVDLAQPAMVATILENTAIRSGVTIGEAILQGAADVIAATNQYIQAVPVTADLDYLAEVSQVKTVSQGTIADQLERVVAGTLEITTVVDGNTGESLAVQVAAAAAPPTMIVPAVVIAEAVSALGAHVEFVVHATNLAGQSLPVTCDSSSGSLFPLGQTLVTCSATDSSTELTSTASFKVTVADTTSPTITLPPSVIVPPSSAAGAVVTYSATADDAVDGTVLVSCSVPSGSTFPPGSVTTVICSAVDAAGNTATEGFTVAVNAYAFTAFANPISLEKPFKLGSTVPIKFSLGDGAGGVIRDLDAVTSLLVQQVDCTSEAALGTAFPPVAAGGTSLHYDTVEEQFIFNWKTSGLVIGCFNILLELNDGSPIIAKKIELKSSGKSGSLVAESPGNVASDTTAPHELLAGYLTLYVENTAGNLTPQEMARIEQNLAALNVLLDSEGARISQVNAAESADANIRLSLAATSACGSADDGVLGCADEAQLTLLAGWNWYSGADEDSIGIEQVDFQTVVTHELGHVLGLGHSDNRLSVMFPSLAPGALRRHLTAADFAVISSNGESALHTSPEAFVAERIPYLNTPYLANVTPSVDHRSVPERLLHSGHDAVQRHELGMSMRLAGGELPLDTAGRYICDCTLQAAFIDHARNDAPRRDSRDSFFARLNTRPKLDDLLDLVPDDLLDSLCN